MSQLEAMGFPTIRCQKALMATGNSDADTAMTWLFEHMEDPGKLSQSKTLPEADV
jgi:ubiquitin carboxyl-terminal hydrolase 5/13